MVISLGLNEVYDNDDSYYEWELLSHPAEYIPPVGGAFEGNNHGHYVTAKVSVEGDYLFCLIRLSKYGYQKDEVLITVKDYPKVVSVKAKAEYECFHPEEELQEQYFEIVTDPPGYDYLVVLAEDSRQAVSVGNASFTEDQEIHFLVKRNENDPSPKPSDAKCHIPVFEEYDIVSVDLGPGSIYDALKDFVQVGKKIKDIIDDSKTLNEYDQISGSPVEIISEVDFSAGFIDKCCNHNDGLYLNYSLVGKVGAGINWPIPICPGVYAIIAGEITGGLDLNGTAALPGADGDCGDPIELDVIISGELGVGIGVGVPGTFNLEATVKGGMEARAQLTTGDSVEPKIKYVKATVVINLTLNYVVGSVSRDFSPFGEATYLYGKE